MFGKVDLAFRKCLEGHDSAKGGFGSATSLDPGLEASACKGQPGEHWGYSQRPTLELSFSIFQLCD